MDDDARRSTSAAEDPPRVFAGTYMQRNSTRILEISSKVLSKKRTAGSIVVDDGLDDRGRRHSNSRLLDGGLIIYRIFSISLSLSRLYNRNELSIEKYSLALKYTYTL